ncbi:hypothetical protein QYM36_005191, partial [Artemia franciscana]
MKINASKTKVVIVSRHGRTGLTLAKVTIEGEHIKRIDPLVYLGNVLKSPNESSKDIKQHTEVIYTRTIETILEKYIGPTELSWDVKKKQMGKIAPDLAKLIIEEYKLPLQPAEYTAEARIIQENLFPHCDIMP